MKYVDENPEMKVIVIDFDMIPYIDSSAMEVLENIIMSMEKFDIEVYFTGIHANLWKQFEST
ncbi:sodium-independent anion transporter [bacterium]|jgi:anti-anti-sigma regulatory factor|nr:sodium-independent anion transporter [bacterium]MBT3853691.1 sodium-independent anion transporter [bacterium]MBT4633357.1 sodium-independent anion transporter [bacterium]MBT5491338.1 sodium-independent anion transporter [bacterium]MBT6779354.1 sodium-independent anion transporter [bacterium]